MVLSFKDDIIVIEKNLQMIFSYLISHLKVNFEQHNCILEDNDFSKGQLSQ